MENYTIDYFINKFSAIPEDKWAIGWGYIDEREPTCATGHCGFDNHIYCDLTSENEALMKLFSTMTVTMKAHGTIKDDHDKFSWKVVRINDGDTEQYQQPTPKQRILAALYDIKKLNSEQGVQECDATKMPVEQKAGNIKTKIVYVSVPETIAKSVPETILS